MKKSSIVSVLIKVLVTMGMACAATAQALTWRSYFSLEYTSSSQLLSIFRTDSGTNTQIVTVKIYNPDGTQQGTNRTVAIRGLETVTISSPQGDQGLPITPTGTPTTDYAYGFVAEASVPFSIFVWSDSTDSGAASSYTAIHAQRILHTDNWFNMYNPPDSDYNKQDYFFIYNENATSNIVSIDVFRSDGTQIDANGGSPGNTRTITLNAHQTVKIYPQTDLNVTTADQNIGLHLTAPLGVCVNVNTFLGSEYEAGIWKKHDVVAGTYVAQGLSELADEYIWSNSKSDGDWPTVRVTNPNDAPVTGTWKIYPYDGTGPNLGGIGYQYTASIPAKGTVEMPVSAAFRGEGISLPNHHFASMSATYTSGGLPAPIVAIVSFEQNIDVPEAPSQGLTSQYWGMKDPSRSRQIFLANPGSNTITVSTEAWYWTGSTRTHEIGDSIIVGPYDAITFNATSSGPGPGFNATQDKVVHFFSTNKFVIQLQEPDYGDLTPLVGGGSGQTLGVVVVPDQAQQIYEPPVLTTLTYPHTVTNTGTWPDCYILTTTSTSNWVRRIYVDLNGNGIKDIGDTNVTETAILDPGGTFKLLVELDVPAGTLAGAIDVTVITATSKTDGVTSDSAADTTTIIKETLAVITAVRSRVETGVAIIAWDVDLELDTVGYYLERWANGAWTRVHPDLIPAQLFVPGTKTYELADPGAPLGATQRYQIVELDNSGRLIPYGPYDLALDGGEISYESWAAGIAWGARNSSRTGDADGDGLTNFQEYVAGTDPLSANSVLRVSRVEAVAGGLRLTWSSEPGRTYAVEMAVSPTAPYLAVASGIAATAPENQVVVPVSAQAGVYFRVVVIEP